MKLLFVLSTLLTAASAAMPEISADSLLGQHLVSKARKLDQAEDEAQFGWVSGYSVKFQGCHHIKQWNADADEDEDVKISTSRLVRFRLCPSGTCSATKAAGCTSGYGDYIIDMATFMDSYFEAKRQSIEYACEYQVNYMCDCEDDDGKGDDFNRDYCEYDCYVDAGMTECVDRNPYNDDEEEEQFNLDEYMECRQLELPENDDNNNGRRLDEAEVAYYVGPYCAEQGGAIMLGLFSDDTCSTYVDDVTFDELMGFELPYSSESIVGAECLGCIEQRNEDEQNEDDAVDADEVSEQCENLYINAGKCEAKLSTDVVSEFNNNACNYMEGIRIVRNDGIIDTGSSRPSAAATAFIVIFAMAFAAMSFYVWYLRTRLGVKKSALL